MNNEKQRGLTLIELLVGLVVMTVLTSLAVPGFQSLREQYTVRSAGMAVYADLQLARSEAIKRNREVTVCFTNSGTADWSYALHDSPDCSGDIIETVSSQSYPYMMLTASYSSGRLTFGPRRSSLSSGNVQLSNGHHMMKLVTSNTGRIRTCAVDGLIGVPSCSS
ncbi:GspH/FimT family pseudopilin [Oceanimonas sp. CAM02]|uniref:GspH/FimT family pseudopilin n=1 Tax=Oceanimonas sp. CAM02 TaxID=3080336 RepID=UPI00293683C1|nr:GspH/FimT family pseudopilin [Oceanimonas sp. CAM02]MDV2856827.1 GspH/FimT family pseudopilin [Oceanimonas sp. CAM02]